MPQADIYNLDNTKTGTVELPDAMFAAPWRPGLVEQVLLAQLANARRPWAHAKGRGEVSGGGKKPWRQKGTGRSRHGSIRSPIWRHGGKSHGPTKDRDYSQKVNKKMKHAALASLLSKKLKDNELKIYETFAISEPKTKLAAEALRKATGVGKRVKNFNVLVVRDPENRMLTRAARNLPKTKVLDPNSLNVYDVLNYRYVFFEKNAIDAMQQKTESRI